MQKLLVLFMIIPPKVQHTLQLQPDLSVSFLNGLYRWMKAQFIPLGILFGC